MCAGMGLTYQNSERQVSGVHRLYAKLLVLVCAGISGVGSVAILKLAWLDRLHSFTGPRTQVHRTTDPG